MLGTDLDWNQAERNELYKRILELEDDQIKELFEKAGIIFGVLDSIIMKEVLREIRDRQTDSLYLDILLTEAQSRENLLKWVTYFEQG